MQKRKPRHDISRLAIAGDLTVSHVARWRGEIETCIKSSPTCEIDVSRVEAVDTIGVQLLVAAGKMAQQRGQSLLLCEPSQSLGEAFAVVGLDLEAFKNINLTA